MPLFPSCILSSRRTRKLQITFLDFKRASPFLSILTSYSRLLGFNIYVLTVLKKKNELYVYMLNWISYSKLQNYDYDLPDQIKESERCYLFEPPVLEIQTFICYGTAAY